MYMNMKIIKYILTGLIFNIMMLVLLLKVINILIIILLHNIVEIDYLFKLKYNNVMYFYIY